MKGKFITAKFTSKCNENGSIVNKGDKVYYVFATKKVYSSSSNRFNAEGETLDTANMVQANEDSYYDNFCQNNNI